MVQDLPAKYYNGLGLYGMIYPARLYSRFLQACTIHVHLLRLEDERGADLVAGIVELGGVERQTEAESGARVELGAVGKGRNTTVIDLGLQEMSASYLNREARPTFAKLRGSSLYLEATSRPLGLPFCTSYAALAPTSTELFTFW